MIATYDSNIPTRAQQQSGNPVHHTTATSQHVNSNNRAFHCIASCPHSNMRTTTIGHSIISNHGNIPSCEQQQSGIPLYHIMTTFQHVNINNRAFHCPHHDNVPTCEQQQSVIPLYHHDNINIPKQLAAIGRSNCHNIGHSNIPKYH